MMAARAFFRLEGVGGADLEGEWFGVKRTGQ